MALPVCKDKTLGGFLSELSHPPQLPLAPIKALAPEGPPLNKRSVSDSSGSVTAVPGVGVESSESQMQAL